MDASLITKYNTSVPRYTSYPTVPHWQSEVPTQEEWLSQIQTAYDESGGLSLYIHLPFCEALCTYCGCNKRITKNHGVEAPYIDSVLKEWNIYITQFSEKPVLKEFHLGGGTPTFFSPEQLQRLIEPILADCVVPEQHEYSFEAHPANTTLDHLKTLFALGFERISIGVQDVSPEILAAIHRQQTEEQVAQLTRQAREVGYTSINYDIIYGLPFQKPENIRNTTDFIRLHKPDRIAFYSYAQVPWKSGGQNAFSDRDIPTGQYKSELYALGREALIECGYEPVGMDHFCLPDDELYIVHAAGKMHRNFMGYTTQSTKCCLALGVSAISDSWTMYVQNEKEVEAYQTKVDQGQLPIIKGHRLSPSEQHLRQHILNLMCREYTSWLPEEEDGIAITPYLENLCELAEDGLVEFGENYIRVTETGKFFIRNICAAIDPLYQAKAGEVRVFSSAV